MTRGGRFTIATSSARLGSEFAGRYPGTEIRPGAYARISVADTGVGMHSETLARAFEPFFTTKPVGEGSGLGLATVYGIVKQSNGYIWGESDPAVGTTWEVYLPTVSGPVGSESDQGPPLSLQRGNETILVVDDEPMVRALARRALEIYGYSVLEAEDGEAAIRQVSGDGRRVALVVADIVMPGMNGPELGERLRQSHPGLPVLYTSGHTGDDLAQRKLPEPAVPLLQKPFHPDDLVARVQEILSSRGRT
jgi:CheY-like chemotaxis protein